jgi:hypothetical protein
MKLYKSHDMTHAINVVAYRNEKVIVVDGRNTLKSIRGQTQMPEGMRALKCRSWDSFCHKTIAEWNYIKGVLIMNADRHCLDFPECDAMVFLEAPIRHSEFLRMVEKVKREVVIYEPPDWKNHEDTINHRYPSSAHYQTILTFCDSIKGRTDLDWIEQAALARSGFDPARTSVFTKKLIEPITGLEERQFVTPMAYKFRGFYRRYYAYMPVFPPDIPHLKIMYDVLLNEPDCGNDLRLLRFNELDRIWEQKRIDVRVPGFKAAMKVMIRQHYVDRYDSVFVIQDGFKRLNYNLIDAVSNVHRGDWFKMRACINEAEEI